MSTQTSSEQHPEDRLVRSRFATGRLLAGRYELLDQLGEGGTAEVFRARDHRLDRIVAVKVLRPEYGRDPTARARFGVEARSAAALNVRNIVPVYDFGAAEDGSLFIVMRYIDGPSLRRVLDRLSPLPVTAVLDIGSQIAEALAEAHEHGLIHRDVKPGNILIARDGRAHLTDFGTVKALAGGDDLTRSGTIFGTAAYLSPEQATGGPVGPWTDIYALGVVLYEALSGVLPFTGDDPLAVSYRHAHEQPRPLESVAPGLDGEVARLVTACLAKAPSDRPNDARRLAAALAMASRRLAPRLGESAGLAAVAAQLAPSPPRSATSYGPEHANQALEAPIARPVLSGPALAAAEAKTVAWSIGQDSAATARWRAAPVTERGVTAHAARVRESSNRSGLGAAVLVLALALLFVSTLLLANRFLNGSNGGGVGALPSQPPAPTPAFSPYVVVPPTTATPMGTIAPAPTATAAPTEAPTLSPSQAPTPAAPTPAPVTPAPVTPAPRTPAPRTEPPPEQTPDAPPSPPAATTPPQAPTDVVVRVQNGRFTGDFPGDGTYHGRTASWVYGQGTAYHTMTATFPLDQSPSSKRATIEIVGLDGENPLLNDVRFVLNGVTIYEGPNPLPNDTCCGGSGSGNWGSVTFVIPTSMLGTNNSFSVTNLEPTDCTECPKFVMVDYFELAYRTRD